MAARDSLEAQRNLPGELIEFIKQYAKAYNFTNEHAAFIFLLKDLSPRLHFKGQLAAQVSGSVLKKQPLGLNRRIKYSSEVADADTNSI
jgi:hypothetical protein